ncbi:hypothetical protein ABR738_37405 [Streptomyces sp. Edi4]|uniref:hypothetical protein n=1 Tax=Streptomyces sp. Edi4 TaxID=3162527 RepID=UPI00330565D1
MKYHFVSYEIRYKGSREYQWIAEIHNDQGMVMVRSEPQPTEEKAFDRVSEKAAVVGLKVS